eukprot:TRINITY_DN83553_c0_g1_i1.p1 TRINITY_DN83553_c0_g1~~TRINITY_DN83553_c0_g1_i1.p1  ORF type:complete len:122 (-),score=14.30 TRINITY_DN83553_c0_g1_i1:110-475(-)
MAKATGRAVLLQSVRALIVLLLWQFLVSEAPDQDCLPCLAIAGPARVSFTHKKRKFVVRGNMRPVKDSLKASGGKWRRSMLGWVFPGHKYDEITALLQYHGFDVQIPQGGRHAIYLPPLLF